MNALTKNNLKARYNAMFYLAEKRPDIYVLEIKTFSVTYQSYSIELFERLLDSKEHEFLNTVDKIEFKPNFEEWA